MKSVKGILFCALLLCAMFSCSDTPVRITNVRFKAVFDYSSLTEPPEYYAMLFIQPETDVDLISEITLIHVQSGYIWNITEPAVLKTAESAWCGNARLADTAGAFPQGNYIVRCTDAAEREAETMIALTYPPELADALAQEAWINSPSSSQTQIAVYDRDENLLFFGEKKPAWTPYTNIKNELLTAFFYRECRIAPAYSSVVMMPLNAIDAEPVSEGEDVRDD